MTDPSPTPEPHRVVSDDAMKRWRRGKRRLRRRLRRARDVALILLIVAVAVFALKKHTTKNATAPTTVPAAQHLPPKEADVKITSCSYANFAATAGLTITNHTDQQMNYVVYVLFGDAKNKRQPFFSSGVLSVDYLSPKQHVDKVASGVSTAAAPAQVSCIVVGVKRFP